jgi:hypothetical protein
VRNSTSGQLNERLLSPSTRVCQRFTSQAWHSESLLAYHRLQGKPSRHSLRLTYVPM